MTFLDNIERAPDSGGGSGNYVKLQQGKNSFRIVGSQADNGFINGMLGWGTNEDGGRKPYRWKVGEEQPRKFEDKPKEFFAMKNTAHQLFCKWPALQGAAATAAAAQGRPKSKVLKEWFNEAAAGRGPHIAQLRAAQAQAESMRNDFYRLRDSTACELVDSEADTDTESD